MSSKAAPGATKVMDRFDSSPVSEASLARW